LSVDLLVVWSFKDHGWNLEKVAEFAALAGLLFHMF
jgi:hypothetical protein